MTNMPARKTKATKEQKLEKTPAEIQRREDSNKAYMMKSYAEALQLDDSISISNLTTSEIEKQLDIERYKCKYCDHPFTARDRLSCKYFPSVNSCTTCLQARMESTSTCQKCFEYIETGFKIKNDNWSGRYLGPVCDRCFDWKKVHNTEMVHRWTKEEH
jgi:hypothetical protein